jgi:threonine dehydratase
MDGTLVHPFDDHDFITGVGSAMKAKAPQVTVLGAEPETAAHAAAGASW